MFFCTIAGGEPLNHTTNSSAHRNFIISIIRSYDREGTRNFSDRLYTSSSHLDNKSDRARRIKVITSELKWPREGGSLTSFMPANIPRYYTRKTSGRQPVSGSLALTEAQGCTNMHLLASLEASLKDIFISQHSQTSAVALRTPSNEKHKIGWFIETFPPFIVANGAAPSSEGILITGKNLARSRLNEHNSALRQESGYVVNVLVEGGTKRGRSPCNCNKESRS